MHADTPDLAEFFIGTFERSNPRWRIGAHEHAHVAHPHRAAEISQRDPRVFQSAAQERLVALPPLFPVAADVAKRVVHRLAQIEPPVLLDELEVVNVHNRPGRRVDLEFLKADHFPAEVEQQADTRAVVRRMDGCPAAAQQVIGIVNARRDRRNRAIRDADRVRVGRGDHVRQHRADEGLVVLRQLAAPPDLLQSLGRRTGFDLLCHDHDLIERMRRGRAGERSQRQPRLQRHRMLRPHVQVRPIVMLGLGQADHQGVPAGLELRVRHAGVGLVQRLVVEAQLLAIELPRKEWPGVRLVQIDLLRRVAVQPRGDQHPGDDVIGALVGGVDELAGVEGEGVIGRADDIDSDDFRRRHRLQRQHRDRARLESLVRRLAGGSQLLRRRPIRIVKRRRRPFLRQSRRNPRVELLLPPLLARNPRHGPRVAIVRRGTPGRVADDFPAVQINLRDHSRLIVQVLKGADAEVRDEDAHDVFARCQQRGDVVFIHRPRGGERPHRPVADEVTVDPELVARIRRYADARRSGDRRQVQRFAKAGVAVLVALRCREPEPFRIG